MTPQQFLISAMQLPSAETYQGEYYKVCVGGEQIVYRKGTNGDSIVWICDYNKLI
mgnify:CR=1 FL=1